MNTSDYPACADDSRAPWNEKTLPAVDVDVVVTITLSKTMTIRTNKYTRRVCGYDEDGRPEYDYEFEDLASSVAESVTLPNDLAGVMERDAGAITGRGVMAISDCKGWELEDMEVYEA